MCIKNIFIGFQLLFLASAINVAAQQAVDVKGNLEKFTKNYIQEKVYLQSDKEYYQAGEMIWFNAYTLDVQTHQFLDFSKVLYVDVINDSNHQVINAKISVDSAIGDGTLFIPLSVSSGNYKLRAYTSWMKNFSPAGFFEKYITIVNPQKSNQQTQKSIDSNKTSATIQFFPEGGSLVKNIKSRIAYLVETNAGVNFGAISAFIINSKKDTVQNVILNKSGIGHFYFTPVSDEPYSIQFNTLPNVKIKGNFPHIDSIGYALNIQEHNENVTVNIFSSVNQSLQLLAHTRGSINYFEQVNLVNGTAKIDIDKTLLPAGIAHFTLFANNGKPLAERLFFTPPKDSLALSVSTNKKSYQNREAVDVAITAKQSNITISVFQIDSLQGLPQTTIQKYLYFLSELKNAIPKSIPISNINLNKTDTALDDILLTYGWRRFNWDEINNTKPLVYAPELYAHLISGNVQDVAAKNSNELIRLKIGAPSISAAFNNTETPLNSTFHLPFKNLFGSNFLIISTEDDIKQYKINIKNPFSNQFTKFIDKEFLYPGNANTLLNQYVQMQVQNIYNHERLNQFTTAGYMDTTAFYYAPTSTYLLDQYTRFTTIEEILREYVPLVDVRKSDGKLVAKIFDAELKRHLMGEILFLLDGVAIDNVKEFFNYDPLKLKQLDVIPTYYLLGKSVYSGIVSWKSNRPDINNYQGLINNSVIVDYEGLQLNRLFYTPSYETQELKDSPMPDYRNVLYWQPRIKIKESVTHHEIFYTSDIAGKYVIVAEGINQNGKGATSFTFFTVQ